MSGSSQTMSTPKRRRDSVAEALLSKHPLQSLPSPSRGTSFLIHALGSASFAYSFYWLIANPNEMNDAYGWHFQYLTILGLTAAAVSFFLGLLADITLSRRLFYAKNVTAVVGAPIEILISMLYWGLMNVDPALVVPADIVRPPPVVDFGFHAAPAIFLAIDLLFMSPPWTISAGPIMGLSAALAAIYWIWVERNYQYNGFYPYPIFDTEPQVRAGIFAASAMVFSCSTFSLQWLYHAVNGREIPPEGEWSGHDPAKKQ